MRDVHLLVLIHGMWGNPEHLAEMCRIVTETKGPEAVVESSAGIGLEVLVASSNGGESTYDGIDWGAERVADEVSDRAGSCNALRSHYQWSRFLRKSKSWRALIQKLSSSLSLVTVWVASYLGILLGKYTCNE